MVTLRPRSTSNRPSEAEVIPFPKLETTPPVMKTYLVLIPFTPNPLPSVRDGQRPSSERARRGPHLFPQLRYAPDHAQHGLSLDQRLVALHVDDDLVTLVVGMGQDRSRALGARRQRGRCQQRLDRQSRHGVSDPRIVGGHHYPETKVELGHATSDMPDQGLAGDEAKRLLG